jgi:hypothetical protein
VLWCCTDHRVLPGMSCAQERWGVVVASVASCMDWQERGGAYKAETKKDHGPPPLVPRVANGRRGGQWTLSIILSYFVHYVVD